ncbi:MAG: ArsR/SmtB family transcription factor [Caulobacteraceae bacterium]
MALGADKTVEMLRAAGEPTRLRILCLLAREELAVLELCRLLGQSQPRVSRHLKLLAEAGLVERFPDGAWVYYRLAGGEARAFAEGILSVVGTSDPTLARDKERLADIERERAQQAAQYFAVNADRWDEIRSLYISEAAVEAAILEAAGEGPFERLVDLGTGSGRMLTLFGERARSSLGLDLSRQMLNIARTRASEARLTACELRHGDILATQLQEGSADLVVVHQVLHYLADPSAAVGEAGRLVGHGGRLVIVDFAPHDLEFLRTEHRHRRLGFEDAELERWLAASGLGAITIKSLPPIQDGGLTVKIWTAERVQERLSGRLRRIA